MPTPSGLAVLTMAALTRAGDHDGWAWRTRAATPAVYGEAIEVPPNEVPAVPLPTRAETMATPGAATSGLRALSTWRGPMDVKSAVSV